MKLFYYNSQLYQRIIPSKRMFSSTMVHDVVNRGDIFAVHMETGQFTVVPGTAKVTVHTGSITLPPLTIPNDELFD